MQIDLALIELGAIMLVLGVLGRLAQKIGLPAIPFYLVAGLFFGNGGVIPIDEATAFIDIGSSLGVIFLLFMLGLEYTPVELRQSMAANRRAGVIDLIFNAAPGVVAGWVLGWGALGSALFGGVTYVSSSGIVAKLLVDLNRLGNRETSSILSLLVIEDLVMAIFLPVSAVLLAGDSAVSGVMSGLFALAVIAIVISLPDSVSHRITRLVHTNNGEVLLISLLGLALLVAGVAEKLHISYAIGAFLLGILLSGQVAEKARELIASLRDAFAALFFVSFGISVDPQDLAKFLPIAALLALISGSTKFLSGYWAARQGGISSRGARRAGATLIPRGEFSIVLAGIALAGGVNADLGPITVAYVLLLAVGGSVLARALN